MRHYIGRDKSLNFVERAGGRRQEEQIMPLFEERMIWSYRTLVKLQPYPPRNEFQG
jgi:hypothetical protein